MAGLSLPLTAYRETSSFIPSSDVRPSALLYHHSMTGMPREIPRKMKCRLVPSVSSTGAGALAPSPSSSLSASSAIGSSALAGSGVGMREMRSCGRRASTSRPYDAVLRTSTGLRSGSGSIRT